MIPRFLAAWIALVVTVNTALAAPSPYSTVADLTTSSNALQTQINGKQATITGATDLTANSLTLGPTNVVGALSGKQPTGTYIKADGTVAFSANQSLAGFTLQNVGAPSAAGDVATKAYVDATAQGLSVKQPTIAATVAALPTVNYVNGTAGVGATLTESGNGALSIDGQTPNNGDRVLIKNQVSEFQNGIYDVTDKGSAGTQFILTRATDNDTESKLVSAFCLVTAGTTNALTGWVQTTPAPITIGATNIVWAQFSAAGQITAGPGLALNGTQMYATNIVGNQIVASATLTTPNIGAATGTSLVMGSTNVIGELAGKQPNITTSTDLTPHSVVMGGTNVIGALAGKQDSGWTITVNGTANRVTASGSPVSPGGTITLTTPQNTSTNDTPTFADVSLGGLTNVAGALAGKAPAFTTGAGVTNVANVVSANLAAGSGVTLTTGSNGQISIAATLAADNWNASGSTNSTLSGNATVNSLTSTNGLTVQSGSVSLPAGSVANAALANSTVTVTGTANQVNVSGSPVALGGTVTLGTPQDIGTASSPSWAGETVGTGDDIYYGYPSVANLLKATRGTSASPYTSTNGAGIRMQQTINLPGTQVGDGMEISAAIEGISLGTVQNGVQGIGLLGIATSSSTNTIKAGSRDSCGVYGIGQTTGSGTGTGIGGFFNGRRTTSTGHANGIEVSVDNETTTAETYASAGSFGFANTTGIWIHGTGTTNVAVGMNFGNPFGPQFDVGIGFNSQVAGGQTGAVTTASIYDNGNALSSIVIAGNHTTGINMAGSTISGNAINLASGQIVNGGTLQPTSALGISYGGTGQATKAPAFDALAPTTTRGDLIARGASANTALAIGTPGSLFITDGTDPLWSEPQNAVQVFDDYLQAGNSGTFGWVSSANGTGSLWTGVAGTAARYGISEGQTGTTTNGCSGWRNNSQSFLFGGGRTIFKTAVRVPTLSAAADLYAIFVGFADNGAGTLTLSDVVDGAYFVYSSSSQYYTNTTKWTAKTANNTSRTVVNSSVTVTAGQWYTLVIDVNAAASQVDFYIDGSLIGSSNTNIPSTTGREFGLVYKIEKLAGSTGTTSVNLDVDYSWLYWKPTTAR